MWTLEREQYSFMELLADFGGFNDGILIIPGFLMGMYTAIVYQAELLNLIPIKLQPGKMKAVKEKLASNVKELHPLEISEIMDEVGKSSIVDVLCCETLSCC